MFRTLLVQGLSIRNALTDQMGNPYPPSSAPLQFEFWSSGAPHMLEVLDIPQKAVLKTQGLGK